MTNTTQPTTQITVSSTDALAEEALRIEGIDAYFPGVDISPATAQRVLAAYLRAHPEAWSPATDESPWSFDGDLTDLGALVPNE